MSKHENKDLDAIIEILKRTNNKSLIWGYGNREFSDKNSMFVFVAFLKYGFLRLIKEWDGKVRLEVLDGFYRKRYEFPQIPCIKDLFNFVCPSSEKEKINDILDNIIDGSVFQFEENKEK